jgi:2-keto-4-pentenoate hydratase/2-oxohepta-3-ene-1,7-dioic acid hydratase in catechol pathway
VAALLNPLSGNVMKSVFFDNEAVYPSKVVCIGRNYAAHIKELKNEVPKEPVFFLKPNSSISGEIHSGKTDEIHYEGEITFLLIAGKIRGVGFGLDLTKRGIQSKLKAKGLPWERAKAFDNSAVFSPFVSYEGNIGDLSLELYINGVLKQQGGYGLMLHKPEAIIREAGQIFSFEDCDLLMTGTPAGVGPVLRGDRFTGKIMEKGNVVVEHSWVADEPSNVLRKN